ncbi:MAG: glutamine--tRNA ligase/YqeY domain fusion protein [Betaproteobacteria bacterium]|nr:MAG: glutamine--tRNA ligase/YqeY domain fusion protein [Betaproteobacteria bacterium]
MSSRSRISQPPSSSNFIRQIIETDLASGKHQGIRTRFPPEPNGYLHFGHAKSICLNFGLAAEYGGRCNLRFDDTNPEKEEQAYVDSIIDAVRWLGFDFGPQALFASDYFDFMYRCAEYLVESGHAYVDSQSADDMRHHRGSFTAPGRNSPYRDRSPAENLALLREMRDGRHADGAHVLRAKIDMASPNINLRDPAIYRIKQAAHHRTGDAWCLYPMYTFAHPIEDAVEGITHSICTLEFEDQRPFYDWLLERLAEGGLLERPLPQQIEFARLNLTYVVLSKRKLAQLVQEGHVDGWDDPRMPTLMGARRRGYTPEGLRRFAERIGVSKANQRIDFAILEDCMREHLNEVAPRRMAVLDPVRLVIENYPEGREEFCDVPNHPQRADWGTRPVPFSRELWIEREDFTATPPKGYFRLYPGNRVRLRYAYVVECTGYDQATDSVRCRVFEDSRSGTPGAAAYKVKGNIHWASVAHAYAASVRLYDRLFTVPNPGAGERDFRLELNPASKEVVTAQLEPELRATKALQPVQFERHGYFNPDAALGGFNRTVTLRDSWAKS